MERNLEDDIKFDRYQLDRCLEEIGSIHLYWARLATNADNEVERLKLYLKRIEQIEYVRYKENNVKATDTAAKAAALTSEAYTKANEEYLNAIKVANEYNMARNLIQDTIQRMQAEVKLVVAGYFNADGISGGGTSSRLK